MAFALVFLGGLLALACGVGAWLLFDVGLIGAFLVYLAVSIAAAMAILLVSFLKHVACRGHRAGGIAGTGPPLRGAGNRGAAAGRTPSSPAVPPAR